MRTFKYCSFWVVCSRIYIHLKSTSAPLINVLILIMKNPYNVPEKKCGSAIGFSTEPVDASDCCECVPVSIDVQSSMIQ